MEKRSSDKEQFTFSSIWSKATANEMNNKMPSLLYAFAKEYRSKSKTPLGLINLSASNSSNAEWVSGKTLKDNPEFKEVLENLQNDKKKDSKMDEDSDKSNKKNKKNLSKNGKNKNGNGKKNHDNDQSDNSNPANSKMPSGLYNGMLKTVAPFSAKGIFFMPSQADRNFDKIYEKLLSATISDWNSEWKLSKPQIFILQTPYSKREESADLKPDDSLPLMMTIQEETANKKMIPFIPSISSEKDIQEKLAKRLIICADNIGFKGDFYEKLNIPKTESIKLAAGKIILKLKNCSGGLQSISNYWVEGDQSSLLGKNITITLPEIKTEGERIFATVKISENSPINVRGVQIRELKDPDKKNNQPIKIASRIEVLDKTSCTGFALAGKDNVPVKAEATLKGDTVEISCNLVKEPVYLFYGWGDCGKTSLFNSMEMPLSPFRAKIPGSSE